VLQQEYAHPCIHTKTHTYIHAAHTFMHAYLFTSKLTIHTDRAEPADSHACIHVHATPIQHDMHKLRRSSGPEYTRSSPGPRLLHFKYSRVCMCVCVRMCVCVWCTGGSRSETNKNLISGLFLLHFKYSRVFERECVCMV
jgi:hypothetical protein